MKRQYNLIGGVLTEASLAVVFANPVLIQSVCGKIGQHCLTSEQVKWVGDVSVLSFAAAVVFSGNIIDKFNHKNLLTLSAFLIGVGYVLGGVFENIFVAQMIFIGILVGAGAGLGYLVPFNLIMRSYTDLKGWAVGLVAAGFGFGVVFWSLSAEYLSGYVIAGIYGTRLVYLTTGVLLFLLILIGWILMKGDAEEDWDFRFTVETQIERFSIFNNSEIGKMFKNKQFYFIWIALLLFATAGFIISSHIQPYGIKTLQANGLESKIAARVAALAFLLFQVMVGVGSAIWGLYSDHIGRRRAIALMSCIQGAAAFIICYAGFTPQALVLFSCITGFNFGGMFVLFPIHTSECMDDQKFGTYYSWVFMAFIVAGLLGPNILQYSKIAADIDRESHSFMIRPFVLSGILCIASALVTFKSKKSC
jgi:OFA family oxalate/formate antiporter-like MFS transporter